MRHRLSTKLLFYIVLCSAFFTLLATAFQLYMDYRRDMSDVHDSIQFIEKSYLPAIATSAWDMDEKQLRLQLQGALKLPGVEYLEIVETRTAGEVIIAAQGNPNSRKDIVHEHTLQYPDLLPGGTLQAATLRVTVSLEEVYQRLWAKALIVLASNAVKMFLASFCIFLIIQFLITRHIIKMARYTQKLEMDKLDKELVLDRKTDKSSEPDELDELVTSFNNMRVRLNKDIEERRQAEKALRESEERYRGLIRNITDFICSHDLEGRFITVNRAAAKTLGYTPEDLIGHPISDFMLPEYRQAFKEDYLAHIKEKGSFGGVTIYVAKDGSKRYIDYRSVLVKEEGMEPFVTGSGRDITEKILSEHKVQKLEEQLHRSQKMEALGLMAGGIAHDLNNILSGIVSYPELLLMDLPEDSALRKPIKTIQESGMRAVDVVADLLTIAKGVATGKEVLNLNTTVEEYLNSAEHQKLEIAYPFVTFRPLLDVELLNIRCSPTHIKKTLMNLVMNASEAIEGGGTVTISTSSRYLDEPLKGYEDVRTGEYAVLGVSDDGSGIAPEDLERIFEPFYTKKVMGRSGTGLGLAVVWNTVQDHKGYIDIKSSDKGTLFELYFPVTREEITAEKEEVPLEDYLGHGERILVVDDEERQREIACVMLTKLGYAAEAVSSGEEAIEYVKDHSVDLIVLDMVMPKGINGRKTYEEIIKIRPKQKAIIASGYAKTKEVDTAHELGAGKYIKKPYSLEKVGIAVKEELER